jgi:histidinol phosphatase-like PHP family hydrolase
VSHESFIYRGLRPDRKPSRRWTSWHNHTGCHPRFSLCPTPGLSIARYRAALEREPEAWAGFAITDHAFSIAIPDPVLAWPHAWYDDRSILDRFAASGETARRVEAYREFGRSFRDGERFFWGMEVETDREGRPALPESVLDGMDIVIAVIHHNPGEPEKWVERHFEQVDRILNLPADIVGHPLRHLRAHSTPEKPLPAELIDETLDRLHRGGLGIEINAHVPQLQDDVPLLRGAAARGMVVAFSLDLHYPEEFGNWRYFEDVVELSGVDYDTLNLYDPSKHGKRRKESGR